MVKATEPSEDVCHFIVQAERLCEMAKDYPKPSFERTAMHALADLSIGIAKLLQRLEQVDE